MYYVSTRDALKQEYSFSEILLKGLADDGGLYVPATYPYFSMDQLEEFQSLSYKELAFEVISQFVGDSIPEDDLKSIVDKTYDTSVFASQGIAPVSKLDSSIYVQDLSSGPSLAFKDMAMQFLGHIMDYELHRSNRKLTILGASSGDTVSAAEEAMRGKGSIKVVMLTPKEGMSPFQKAQAGSILEDNIFNVSVPGPFDVCQDLVKAINGDLKFKESFNIGAVNSINWGRICAQVVYYFYGYFQLANTVGEPLDVVVPSGNFGNVLAGYVAKKMGLPLRRLIVATNENQVLNHFFQTGVYSQKDVIVTSSPSMDISKASNIERFFYDVLEQDATALAALMVGFEQTRSIDLSEHLKSIQQDCGFYSGSSTHNERQQMIKQVYAASEYIIDPHTAAAVKVAYDYRGSDNVPLLCLETAKPAKFEAAIEEALGFLPPRPAGFEGLEDKPVRFYDVQPTPEAIKTFIQDFLG